MQNIRGSAPPEVVTPRGTKYVLVMLEHFSKWLELVVLSQKYAKLVTAAFWNRVLARFGTLAEVLTDQRRKFLNTSE